MAERLRVLAFGGHSADVPKRAGGTLARYVKEGHEVYMACLTYGETKESPLLWRIPGMTVEKARDVKRVEHEASAEILGVKPIDLNFGDNPLVMDEARYLKLAELIRRIRPHIMLTHWVLTLYDDHRLTALAVTGKARMMASDPNCLKETGLEPWPVKHVYLFEPAIGLADPTKFIPDVYVDITDTFEQKMKALEPFKSQTLEEMEYYAVLAQYCGRQVGVKHAERFIQYRPQRLYKLLPIE